VIDTPGLVECREDIALYDLVAHLAEVAEQLVVVSLAVRKPLPLVVPVAKERFLALGADEVLNVPVLAQGGDHSLLDWSSAGPADWNAHLVVAAETVELIEFLRSVARPGPHLSGAAGQLQSTPRTVEVVGVVDLASKPQWLLVHH